MKTFDYTINGIKYHVEVLSIEDNIAEVEVNGTQYSVEIDKGSKEAPLMRSVSSKTKGASAPKAKAPTAPVAPTVTPTSSAPSTPTPTPTPAPSIGGAGTAMQSPLPGVILSVSVKVGDAVKKGQKIMVLEAMKMENDIKANKDGVIASIAVAQGDSVQEGDTLVTIS